MRILACLGVLLALAGRAAAEDTTECPYRACAAAACPHACQQADATVKFDVRVLEINVSKLKALGFDFAELEPSVLPDDSGLLGFLDAVEQEGLVEQDLKISVRARSGQDWNTTVSWYARDGKQQDVVWRNLALHHRALQVCCGKVRLESKCTACYTPGEAVELACGEDAPLIAHVVPSGHAFCLPATFAAGSPDEFPDHQVRVVVLVTPQLNPPPAASPHEAPHHDLLAPRNVLTRQASNCRACPVCDEPAGEAATLELFSDDSLFDDAELSETDVQLLPEKELLAEEPSRESRLHGRRLFFIKRLPPRKRARQSPEAIDFRRDPDGPRGFHGMWLAI